LLNSVLGHWARQPRAFYQHLIASGEMPAKRLHDTILRGGTMPIERVRADVTQEKLSRDFKPAWRYAE
jgi:hypothetical protein